MHEITEYEAKDSSLRGDIPNRWGQKKLIEIAKEFISGGTPSTQRPELWDGPLPWTTSAPISERAIKLETPQRFVSEQGLQESASHLVPTNSLLVATRVGVGKAVVAMFDIAISQDLTGVLLDLEQAQPEFIAYQFKSGRIQRILDGNKRGTTIKGISRFDLQQLILYLPPLPEQRSITHLLQTVQSAIQARRKELELERERKTALMQHLFTHGTRGEATQMTEIGEIPKSWRVDKVKSVAKLLSGGTPSKQQPEWWQGTIPWASPKDLKKPRLWDTQDHISQEALANGTCLVPAKTLFVVVRGMILAKNIPIAVAEVPMAFNQDMKAIIPSSDIDPDYLLYAFECYKHNMVQAIGTSAHGTKRVGSATIEDFLLPYPSDKEEQRSIGHIFSLCDSKIATLEKEIALQEELFRALLEELMSGRLAALPLVEEPEKG